MRKFSKKSLVLPAMAAAAVVTGGLSSAMADFVVTLSAPVTSGANQIYVASIINNGANGTGTQILGDDVTLTINGAGKFIMDVQNIDSDNIPDVDITGNDITGSGYATTRTFASSFGTWGRLPTNGIVSDGHNGTTDTHTDYLTQPNGGAYNVAWNNLTQFHLVESSNLTSGGTTDTSATKFFNIVVPTGTAFTMTGSAGGTTGAQSNFTVTAGAGGGATYPIIVLKATAPANTGGAIANGNAGTTAAPQGNYTPAGASTSTLTVAGSGGAYNPGFIYSLTAGTNAGFTKVAGFAAGDTEIFLLNLKVAGVDPTAGNINQIVSDINNAAAGNTGVVASAVPASLQALGGIVNPWDLELTFTSPANVNGDFGFNFAGETNTGAVTVTDVAAVPEPATAGLLLVGGLGLLARRRRSAN